MRLLVWRHHHSAAHAGPDWKFQFISPSVIFLELMFNQNKESIQLICPNNVLINVLISFLFKSCLNSKQLLALNYWMLSVLFKVMITVEQQRATFIDTAWSSSSDPPDPKPGIASNIVLVFCFLVLLIGSTVLLNIYIFSLFK